MKRILLFLFLMPTLLFGQSLFLSDPVMVSTAGTGNRAPQIALLSDDRPVVYWGKSGTSSKLYLAIWEDNGFGDPIEVTTGGINFNLWGGSLGPGIDAAENTIFLVFENYGDGIYCIKSDDGGQNFQPPVKVHTPPSGRFATLPTIAIDEDLNPIVSFVTTNSNEQDALYEITRSTDGGLTFLPTTVANNLAEGGEVCECCPSSIGVGSGEDLYLAFRNNNNNLRDIWLTKSTNNGVDFSEAVDIDDTDWTIFACPQSGPEILISTDHVYSTFFTGANGSDIYFSTVNKSDMTLVSSFQIPSVSGQSVAQNFPTLAGSQDTIGIAWQEAGDNGLEIIMTWSVEGGSGLIENHMVVDSSLSSQKFPDMIFGNGVFHIVYEDSNSGRVIYKTASFEEIVSTISPTENTLEIDITPNPFTKNIRISFENPRSGSVILELMTMDGQLVERFVTNENTIDINQPNLPAGNYFLKLSTQEQTIIKQLIKI